LPLSTGARLGPYEILSPLGAGGMGEVYRARDTKLGREVAIKVLPELFAADPERLARFDREAQLLASLNHPNIAHIHGLEDSGGMQALVLELVEGETLAERIAGGPIPLAEALGIARQIAAALEAANEKGIVHRDLKPANIKLRPDGKVKVLDFGLAKAMTADRSSPDVSHSPTMTAAATRAGVVIGTAAYMSPEQARGKAVDRRTDVWAFGAVLHEMLSGRKAFEGETISDTLAAVLTRDPDWSTLPATTPVRLRDLLRRCLQKDPDRRLHDVADARIEIEELSAGSSGNEAPAADAPPSERRASRWILAATGIAAAVLASVATWALASRRSPGQLEVAELARVTPPTGRAEWPSWSPDGNLLAFASDRSGDFEIYVRRGEGGQDVNVTNDPGQDIQPAISPDGGTIAFISTRASKTGLVKIGGSLSHYDRTYGGDLWTVPSLGGSARRLVPDANFPAWRADGRAILYVTGVENRRAILEASSEGGTPRTVLPSDKSHWEIVRVGSSPDGRWISFESQLEEVFVMPAAGGTPRQIFRGFSHAWDANPRALWTLSRDLNGGDRVEVYDFAPESGAVRGAPRTVGLLTAHLRDLAVSRDGRRLAIVEDETSRNVTRLPLAAGGGEPAGPEEPLSTGHVIDSYPQVSPDGGRVAYISDTLGRLEVWIQDLETRRSHRLQLPGEDLAQVSPAWMPGGKELLVVRYLSGSEDSFWIAALDGSRAEELFRGATRGVSSLRSSKDGRSLLLSDVLGGTTQQVALYDMSTRKLKQLTDSPSDKFDSEWSPDERSIAVTATTDGVMQLFRMPSTGGAMEQLTTGYERMRHPFFSPDGKWIYVQPSHRNIYRVPAAGGPLEQVTHFPEAGLFLEEPSISPDGRYLYYCRENGSTSLWLMTLENAGQHR
jgi:eukaryotic-like serine/threonine-protein kinase